MINIDKHGLLSNSISPFDDNGFLRPKNNLFSDCQLGSNYGKKQLHSFLSGSFLLPEEKMAAERTLKAGLSELSSNPALLPLAEAIKRVKHGSTLPEDLQWAKWGLRDISSKHALPDINPWRVSGLGEENE
jgi:hypothetical protein